MEKKTYKAIVGLGNPGQQFLKTRHNAGFLVVNALAESLGAHWQEKHNYERALAEYNGNKLLLIKPQTFMNNSGQIVPELAKQGISIDQIIVIHDELELPFGKIAFKTGGSAKGHNGLKSIIAYAGDAFARLRIGIGRPEDKSTVPAYVLQKFQEPTAVLERTVSDATQLLLTHL